MLRPRSLGGATAPGADPTKRTPTSSGRRARVFRTLPIVAAPRRPGVYVFLTSRLSPTHRVGRYCLQMRRFFLFLGLVAILAVPSIVTAASRTDGTLSVKRGRATIPIQPPRGTVIRPPP